MPEFILDHGSVDAARKYADQRPFVQGYIEAMFFTNTGTGDDEELENATVADLSDEAWTDILRDCGQFEEAAKELLEQAYERDYDEAQAGRDFWFTRNGHGVGFWCREELRKGDLGDRLSRMCGWRSKTGLFEVDMYLGDDGKIYF